MDLLSFRDTFASYFIARKSVFKELALLKVRKVTKENCRKEDRDRGESRMTFDDDLAKKENQLASE